MTSWGLESILVVVEAVQGDTSKVRKFINDGLSEAPEDRPNAAEVLKCLKQIIEDNALEC